MKHFQQLLNRYKGLAFPQEYLCLPSGSFEKPLSVFLIQQADRIRDITNQHCFVGYSPLIIAIPCEPGDAPMQENIQLLFSPNENSSPKDAVARLVLKKNRGQSAGDTTIHYFEGTKGRHRFNSPFHQFIIQAHNRLYHKKPGNVYLQGNLYKQVQIAYAVPRNISLITVGQNGLFNLFPTDLHGPAGKEHYIISLRHEGKACSQVMESGKLLLSRVDASLYKTVYSLGKNHMQEMKETAHYPFSSTLSSLYHLPVPQSAIDSRELELADSFVHGIHRLLLFKVRGQQRYADDHSSLSHIHAVPATWRHKKGLAGNYLLR